MWWRGVEGLDAPELPNVEAITTFARDVEPNVGYALVAACGLARGLEATYDALAFARERWDKVKAVQNPAGLPYRIAIRRAFRQHREVPPLLVAPMIDPQRLEPALEHLSKQQRTVVFLIEVFGFTRQEVADLFGVK